MDATWPSEFNRRMDRFREARSTPGVALSIKVRVDGGCFHRECSPQAYRMIDEYLGAHRVDELEFEEHESGPELLLWLVLGTGAINLAKGVIELVTTIIKARSEGVRRGDSRDSPVVLIVRRTDADGKALEETVLRLGPRDEVEPAAIEAGLNGAARKLLTAGPASPAQPVQSANSTRSDKKRRAVKKTKKTSRGR